MKKNKHDNLAKVILKEISTLLVHRNLPYSPEYLDSLLMEYHPDLAASFQEVYEDGMEVGTEFKGDWLD